MKTNLNLIFYNTQTNFGDQLSPFILDMLINNDKYSVSHNKPGDDISIVMIGSYIHQARNNSYIYGSGVRTDPQGVFIKRATRTKTSPPPTPPKRFGVAYGDSC